MLTNSILQRARRAQIHLISQRTITKLLRQTLWGQSAVQTIDNDQDSIHSQPHVHDHSGQVIHTEDVSVPDIDLLQHEYTSHDTALQDSWKKSNDINFNNDPNNDIDDTDSIHDSIQQTTELETLLQQKDSKNKDDVTDYYHYQNITNNHGCDIVKSKPYSIPKQSEISFLANKEEQEWRKSLYSDNIKNKSNMIYKYILQFSDCTPESRFKIGIKIGTVDEKYFPIKEYQIGSDGLTKLEYEAFAITPSDIKLGGFPEILPWRDVNDLMKKTKSIISTKFAFNSIDIDDDSYGSRFQYRSDGIKIDGFKIDNGDVIEIEYNAFNKTINLSKNGDYYQNIMTDMQFDEGYAVATEHGCKSGDDDHEPPFELFIECDEAPVTCSLLVALKYNAINCEHLHTTHTTDRVDNNVEKVVPTIKENLDKLFPKPKTKFDKTAAEVSKENDCEINETLVSSASGDINDNDSHYEQGEKEKESINNDLEELMVELEDFDIKMCEYKEWIDEEILKWFSTLDDGKYCHYLLKIRDGIAKYKINGKRLPQLKATQFYHYFGIDNVKDRVRLAQHCSKLKKSNAGVFLDNDSESEISGSDGDDESDDESDGSDDDSDDDESDTESDSN